MITQTFVQNGNNTLKHILIDEYQDTNAAQCAIVNYLVNDQQNICVVGDDWQSVFVEGADFTNIRTLSATTRLQWWSNPGKNYRSTSAILNAAQTVISKTRFETTKLWTDKAARARQ